MNVFSFTMDGSSIEPESTNANDGKIFGQTHIDTHYIHTFRVFVTTYIVVAV